MKTIHNTNDGDGRKVRLETWEIFQRIKESQIAAGQLATHPEVHFLRKYRWEGMITVRFESDSYSSDNGDAQARRDELVRMLMDNLIRRKWRSYHKNVYWVAATEFGDTGKGHCHILFTFLPLRRKGFRAVPEISDFEEEARESLKHVCGLVECPPSSVDLDWQSKFDDIGLASYVAKREPGREDHKHFIWSTDGNKWIAELLEEMGLVKEVAQ